jgi:signal transduction histidine kinase
MDGLDDAWNMIGHRNHVTFTNLKPQTYNLHVKAANNDGVWNDTPVSLKIVVTPPYYATWWFKTLIVLIVLGGMYLVFALRVKLLKNKQRTLALEVEKRTRELREANVLLEERNEEVVTQKELLEHQNEEINSINVELTMHRNHLEKQVDIRTAELQKAKNKAEESDRLKTAFLANMSHEIRTPMNAIIGFSSLLTSSNVQTDEKKYFYSQIQRNSEALLVLIDDIIDLSFIESEQLKLKYSNVDLDKIFRDLAGTFKQELTRLNKQKKLVLELNVPKNQIILKTDSYRLKQVLLNLVGNAVKYTDKGFVTFGYEVNHDTVLFSVKDTGIGIPGDQLKRIFNRFEKIEYGSERLYRGTGLGLAISKQLVNLLGGELGVKSEQGKGSEFYFSLPIDNSPA